MKVLVIGNSSIARRRVLAALANADGVDAVELASRTPVPQETVEAAGIDRAFVGYDEALAESEADTVYISTVNSLHESLASKALETGRHVMVDKPAFLDLETSKRLVALAEQKNLCLAETTVFSYHPQFDVIRELIASDGPVERAIAAFSMPPFPDDSYRNDPALGGGAMHDLAPYAAATGRLFFAGAPKEVLCRVLKRNDAGVDLAFSVLIDYGDGRSVVGTFGCDTEYRNSILALGPRLSLSIDRAYSPPPDFKNRIKVRRANQPQTIEAKAGDSFLLAINDFCQAVETGDWARFKSALLADAAVRQGIYDSAGAP